LYNNNYNNYNYYYNDGGWWWTTNFWDFYATTVLGVQSFGRGGWRGGFGDAETGATTRDR